MDRYVVYVDDIGIKSFEKEQDAEDFRKSVAGKVQNVRVKLECEIETSKKATQ